MLKKVLRKQNNSRRCFVCGVTNSDGLGTRFYELEDGTVAALATARDFHQSYPERVHGGISGALLDETIGRAINIEEPDTWGVTVEMTTRFKKPVPYDVPLLIVGKITENKSRLFSGEGRLILPDGTTAVTATAKYMKMKLSAIAEFDGTVDTWELFPEDNDPIELDIPEE